MSKLEPCNQLKA